MGLREILVERQATLCERWLDATLAQYGHITATRWRRERDPFANPVGHALVTGLPELLAEALRDGEPSPAAVAALEKILRIRSVQDLAPSRAVGFVYLLREAIRAELEPELASAHAAELAAIEARLEQMAFLGFDLYVQFRVQMFRLRQEELKRSVASLLRRWNAEGVQPSTGPDADVVRLAAPRGHDVAR